MKYEIIGWTYDNDPSYLDIHDSLKLAYLSTTVIKELREKNYRLAASYGIVPVFNSGEKFCVSERTWGGIMAQALREDNSDGMAYASWMFFNAKDDVDNMPKVQVDRTRLARVGAVVQYEEPLAEEYYSIGPPKNAKRPVGNVVKPLYVSRKLTKKFN